MASDTVNKGIQIFVSSNLDRMTGRLSVAELEELTRRSAESIRTFCKQVKEEERSALAVDKALRVIAEHKRNYVEHRRAHESKKTR